MSELGHIRITENKEEIFKQVLISLEIHRPSKSEQDILDQIQQKYSLPSDKSLWVNNLIKKDISIEEFLDFVLQCLAPFVEMILDIYKFLSKYVSTTGGRTIHFEIQDNLRERILKFPDLDLPRKIQWIQTWTEIQIEVLSVDWSKIGKIFCIDHGIFYGSVRNFRLIQSLIIARHEGKMSEILQNIADRIYKISQKIIKSWFLMTTNNLDFRYIDNKYKYVLPFRVPELYSYMVKNGFITFGDNFEYFVGINLQVISFQNLQLYSIEEVFIDINSTDVVKLGFNENRDEFGLSGIVFFVALWGLDDKSFKQVANLLYFWESENIFYDIEAEAQNCLGNELISEIESAITYTGEKETSFQNIKKKLEILLLPFWKDRWFLYEVWTLCFPLMEALSINAHVELVGISSITNESVKGTSWNLPTQKARQPVAKILGATENHQLFVWFQRETKRYDTHRNIEPDIRITFSWQPYTDILILECKDRVKFQNKKAIKVAESYLKGTAARKVLILNYELSPKKEFGLLEEQEIEERKLGIVYGFRPNCIDKTVKNSIHELLYKHLCIPKKKLPIAQHYLIIDSSASMNGKILPEISLFQQLLKQNPQQIYYWGDTINPINDSEARELLNQKAINGSGVENHETLISFITALPTKVKITLITDFLGSQTIKPYLIPLENELNDLHYDYKIGEKVLEIIVI